MAAEETFHNQTSYDRAEPTAGAPDTEFTQRDSIADTVHNLPGGTHMTRGNALSPASDGASPYQRALPHDEPRALTDPYVGPVESDVQREAAGTEERQQGAVAGPQPAQAGKRLSR